MYMYAQTASQCACVRVPLCVHACVRLLTVSVCVYVYAYVSYAYAYVSDAYAFVAVYVYACPCVYVNHACTGCVCM